MLMIFCSRIISIKLQTTILSRILDAAADAFLSGLETLAELGDLTYQPAAGRRSTQLERTPS